MADITQLQDIEPFNELAAEDFERISSGAKTKKFPRNYHIFNQNDPFTGYLYVICSGTVEITLLTHSGEEIVVDYRRDGQYFGCTPLFTEEKYTGGARTVTELECFLVPSDAIHEVAQRVPELRQFFNNAIVDRVRHLYADIITNHSKQALSELESYPFQKRLSEIMSSPAITCNTDDSARRMAAIMTQHHVRSLMVTDADEQMVGIVTCRDILGKVIAVEGRDPDAITAADLMESQIKTLPPSTYMYEAMAYMVGHSLRHMPVVENGALLGMVTMSDLIHHRSQKAMLLLGSIKEAQTLDELKHVHDLLLRVADGLMAESRPATQIMETLTYIHHGLLKRTYELCYQQMHDEGFTAPDIRHCFLIMGSGGRREMLLGPDQDNGFIYEDFPDTQQEEVDAFFIPFAEKLTHALDYVGYPLCEGDVMVSNPVWRGRLQDWRERVADWAENPEPHKVRYSSIFFDFIPLVGDAELAHSLQSIVFKAVRAHPAFLYQVMQLNLTHKVPTGLWGRFITEKSGPNAGTLSLKKGGLVYIVDCIRMFSLEREIRSLTTLERLNALTQDNVFSVETAEHIRVAFEALSFLRLRNEIKLLKEGKEPSSNIDPDELSKSEQDLLRSSFQAVSKLQSATRSHFGKGLG
ncbi:MAG: putative nucleotidyltransferase substrate binding domain-containing protein [Thermodesulfobacteriota bacterium]